MMKATGIVRRVDELGRIVLPMELRRTLRIHEKDPLEIFVDGERVILRKYEPTCVFTGSAEDLVFYHGKMISRACIQELQQLYASPEREPDGEC